MHQLPKVSKTEAAALLEECQGFRGIFPPSVVVHGSDYQPILIEPTRIYAEKVRTVQSETFMSQKRSLTIPVKPPKKSNPNAGLVVLIGKQCVVLGTYPPNVQPGLAVDAIEKLVIYLAEQGF